MSETVQNKKGKGRDVAQQLVFTLQAPLQTNSHNLKTTPESQAVSTHAFKKWLSFKHKHLSQTQRNMLFTKSKELGWKQMATVLLEASEQVVTDIHRPEKVGLMLTKDPKARNMLLSATACDGASQSTRLHLELT